MNDHRYFRDVSRDDRYGRSDSRRHIEDEQASRSVDHWRRDPRDAHRYGERGTADLEEKTRRYPLGGFGGDYEDDVYRMPARSRALTDDEPHVPGRRLLYGDREQADRWSGGANDGWSGDHALPGRGRAIRGPKGYTRTDDRIREDICERLMACWPRIDASEVSVAVKEGVVTFEGTVPDRRMKHAIEDLAERCVGVGDVENRVRVASAADIAAGRSDPGQRVDR